MKTTLWLVIAASAVATTTLAGCIREEIVPAESGSQSTNSGGPGSGGSSSSGTNTDQDLTDYDNLQGMLEQTRTEIAPAGVTGLTGAGNLLFYVDGSVLPAKLKAYDSTTKQTRNFGFELGDENNFRASSDMIVTAATVNDQIVYTALSTATGKKLGEFNIAAPKNGGIVPFAVDGEDVYLINHDDSGTRLLQWSNGDTDATSILDFTEAGVTIQNLEGLKAAEGKLAFVEGGRASSIDLETLLVTPLENETAASAWDVDALGILLATDAGPLFFSYETPGLTDIGAGIQDSEYLLNPSFPSAHLFKGGQARTQKHVVYVGESGLFTYDMTLSKVRPMLLNARDNTITYATPVVLADQSVFVQGLVSETAEAGTDGPIYQVAFKF